MADCLACICSTLGAGNMLSVIHRVFIRDRVVRGGPVVDSNPGRVFRL